MNTISLENVSASNVFTEDSYILKDLFFLPKNLPIQNHHIKLLNKWNIPNILSEGHINNQETGEIIKTDFKEKSEHKKTSDEPVNLANKDSINIYIQWIKEIINIFNEIILRKSVNNEKVNNLIKEIINSVNKDKNNALLFFGKTFKGIFYVYPQTIETIILTYIIGDGLKLSELTLSNLAIASLLHDIGMLKIPKSILEKEDELTKEELSIIHNHTIIGYKHLRDVNYSAIIASGALQHHERMDGKGYPNGLLGDKITKTAKIISVVDAYCAAISNKPYKKFPQNEKEAIQTLLRAGGTAYNSIVLKELIKNISFYPIGSLVILSNNTPDRNPALCCFAAWRPSVKVIVKDGEGETIDLSKRGDIYIKGIYTKKENTY